MKLLTTCNMRDYRTLAWCQISLNSLEIDLFLKDFLGELVLRLLTYAWLWCKIHSVKRGREKSENFFLACKFFCGFCKCLVNAIVSWLLTQVGLKITKKQSVTTTCQLNKHYNGDMVTPYLCTPQCSRLRANQQMLVNRRDITCIPQICYYNEFDPSSGCCNLI